MVPARWCANMAPPSRARDRIERGRQGDNEFRSHGSLDGEVCQNARQFGLP